VNAESSRLELLQGRLALKNAFQKFLKLDGIQWASAFAFNAFLSLFPLIIITVTIASLFVSREQAGESVIRVLEGYIPITGDVQRYVFSTIAGVIDARGQAGIFAFLILVWVALQCFITLISATNRAYGFVITNWLLLSFKGLFLLGITAMAILLGMAVPLISNILFGVGSVVIPLLLVFIGLSMFYRFAPRCPMLFSNVWRAALLATVLMQLAELLFVVYMKHFATLNVLYGAFGGVIAVLLWIYLSGCIFIFGACLCASRTESLCSPQLKDEKGE